MSHKLHLSEKGATRMPQPAMAELLFTALNEHEATLARVSHQLHDEISQVLSAVGLQLDAMRMDFREAAPGVDQRATEIQSLLDRAIEQLRDISNELNPSIVERAGLHFALERLAGKTRKNFSGTLRLHFDPATHVPTRLAKTFYKMAECALDDAVGRPGCSAIDIQVKQSQGEFILELSDNGASEDFDSSPPSMARLLLDYYADKEQLKLAMQGSDGAGNLIRVTSPVSSEPIG
ncbi:MAG TPA: histidine kinase [Bryobacteraceae bacterium]|nr:histidine kinase [Bryobacteraceae bacterium]